MDQNFEHNILEADIERLSKEIAEKRNLLEHKNLSDRELVKKSLEPMIRQAPINQQSAISNQQSTAGSQVLPNYLKDLPAETKLQVEQLIDLTFHQGIGKVIKRALRASPFILDAFHDALTDKLHDELKKRKLI
ncbi:MAG: hypothetical protein AAB696_01340 [Patescibacteria group bacterium]